MTRRIALAVVLAACGGASPEPEPIAEHRRPPPAPTRCVDTVGERDDGVSIERARLVSTTDLVEDALRAHKNAFLRCYLDRAVHDPDLRGRVILSFRMTGGHLVDVRTIGFDADIDRCLCDSLWSMTFPDVDVDPAMRYPLELFP